MCIFIIVPLMVKPSSLWFFIEENNNLLCEYNLSVGLLIEINIKIKYEL